MMTNYTLKNKIIFSILFTLCLASIQFAYAEPEFSFKFGTTGTDTDELNNPTDVISDKNGKNYYVVDSNNDRINVFDDDGNDDFEYGTFCDIAVIANCNDIADSAGGTWSEQGGGTIAQSQDVFLVGTASIGGKYASKSDTTAARLIS